ncbi:hypothetical protein EDC01DRAFT_629133 [Geopyxis carbonaria]|nr:hypothetical protein EDC01DRAFT_629133 [Geopyxis carbonaria]
MSSNSPRTPAPYRCVPEAEMKDATQESPAAVEKRFKENFVVLTPGPKRRQESPEDAGERREPLLESPANIMKRFRGNAHPVLAPTDPYAAARRTPSPTPTMLDIQQMLRPAPSLFPTTRQLPVAEEKRPEKKAEEKPFRSAYEVGLEWKAARAAEKEAHAAATQLARELQMSKERAAAAPPARHAPTPKAVRRSPPSVNSPPTPAAPSAAAGLTHAPASAPKATLTAAQTDALFARFALPPAFHTAETRANTAANRGAKRRRDDDDPFDPHGPPLAKRVRVWASAAAAPFRRLLSVFLPAAPPAPANGLKSCLRTGTTPLDRQQACVSMPRDRRIANPRPRIRFAPEVAVVSSRGDTGRSRHALGAKDDPSAPPDPISRYPWGARFNLPREAATLRRERDEEERRGRFLDPVARRRVEAVREANERYWADVRRLEDGGGYVSVGRRGRMKE